MMTCREVSTVIARGELATAPWTERLAVRVHLAMCRHCRAFRRQVEAMARAASVAAATRHAEPGTDFEATLARRMRECDPPPAAPRPGDRRG